MVISRRYGCIALAAMLAGCAERPPATHYSRPESSALSDTSDTALGKAIAHGVAKHPGESGFYLLPRGTDSLLKRLALLESAQRSIDLQYYSTEEDTTGQLLLYALLRAADRGVRVRMLLDDWNIDDFEKGVAALDSYPNIEIRIFNPYATRDESWLTQAGSIFNRADKFTRRMHNKSMIVDNQMAVMGGRNLGDEYFDASNEFNFRDIDVLLGGPLVAQISHSFDKYWSSDEAYPVTALNLPQAQPEDAGRLRDKLRDHWREVAQTDAGKALREPKLVWQRQDGQLPLVWAKAELAADNPDKIDQPEAQSDSKPGARIEQLADHVQHEFIIISPYFIPLDDGVQWLTSLAARGVNVRVLTNSLASTDVVPAYAGYTHYRTALLKGGVELYELKATRLPSPAHRRLFGSTSRAGLHAKIYIIDRRDLVIGSFNFDPRSTHLNTEVAMVIHSPELAGRVADIFGRAMGPESSFHVVLQGSSLVWLCKEQDKDMRYDSNPEPGFWRHVTDGIYYVLPIENLL